MFELNGKYNSCKIFTDNCDSETISQLTNLLNQESVEDSKIRIMPDTHAGKGSVIGTTMTLHDHVIPNLVGVDIGCFVGETPVWTGCGYVSIKELADQNACQTEAYDMETQEFIVTDATAKLTRKNAELIQVNYSAKFCKPCTVKCTPDHKFLVYTNLIKNNTQIPTWIEAKNLKPNMQLVANDNHVFVNYVKPLTEKADVYCLTVPHYHNFTIMGGVIVHNCGMLSIKLKEHDVDLVKLDDCIKKQIPAGFAIHETAISKSLADKIIAPVDVEKAFKSLGTLGGGNHFIELDRDFHGNLWLVIHTGSRHLGIEVCNYYQNKAYETLQNKAAGGTLENLIADKIAELKMQHREKEISNTIKRIRAQYDLINPDVPKELAYVTGQYFDDYIHDMHLTQQHAAINRKCIAGAIMNHMNLHPMNDYDSSDECFDTIHNYIDMDHMILRKGAVSAQNGERLLIPMNMRDGSLICVGKGNPDWNFSAPHGAGRIMSRSKAKDEVDLKDFKESMKGIYSSSVCESTIDESPFVYKPMQEIMDNIFDTVTILDIIKPVYNFKAH